MRCGSEIGFPSATRTRWDETRRARGRLQNDPRALRSHIPEEAALEADRGRQLEEHDHGEGGHEQRLLREAEGVRQHDICKVFVFGAGDRSVAVGVFSGLAGLPARGQPARPRRDRGELGHRSGRSRGRFLGRSVENANEAMFVLQ